MSKNFKCHKAPNSNSEVYLHLIKVKLMLNKSNSTRVLPPEVPLFYYKPIFIVSPWGMEWTYLLLLYIWKIRNGEVVIAFNAFTYFLKLHTLIILYSLCISTVYKGSSQISRVCRIWHAIIHMETLRQYDLNYLNVTFRIRSFLEMFLSALMFDVMVANVWMTDWIF